MLVLTASTLVVFCASLAAATPLTVPQNCATALQSAQKPQISQGELKPRDLTVLDAAAKWNASKKAKSSASSWSSASASPQNANEGVANLIANTARLAISPPRASSAGAAKRKPCPSQHPCGHPDLGPYFAMPSSPGSYERTRGQEGFASAGLIQNGSTSGSDGGAGRDPGATEAETENAESAPPRPVSRPRWPLRAMPSPRRARMAMFMSQRHSLQRRDGAEEV